MASNFPNSLDTFTTKQDGGVHYASHQNELQDSITSMQQYLIGNPIPNPEDTIIAAPSWEYPALTAGISTTGVKQIFINWLPVDNSECVGYVVQRNITETTVGVVPTYGWVNIATISGQANTQYYDTSGINAGGRYWYRVAGLKSNMKTGNTSNPLYVDFTATESYDPPDIPVAITPYVDGTGHLCANWELEDFNSTNNYYTTVTIRVSESNNPATTTGNLYHTGTKAWNEYSINIHSLWKSSDTALTISDTIYLHIKVDNVWGLSSSWLSYGPFSISSLIEDYTEYVGNAWDNFKTLVEGKFYYDGVDNYVYDPNDFASDCPNLQWLGTDIAANTIQTQALAIGSGQRNFDIKDVYFHSNDNGTNHNINGYLRVTVGGSPYLVLIHNADMQSEVNSSAWLVNKFEDIVFESNTTPNDVSVQFATGSYYVYFKCNKTSQTDCNIKLVNVGDGMKNPSDDTHYWFLAGMYTVPANGYSKLALSHGFTFIDGNHITTGSIDCNKITVHGGTNQNVKINGNGLTITNGEFSLSSGSGSNNNVLINSSGISVSQGTSSVAINSSGLSCTSLTGASLKLNFNDGLLFETASGVVRIDDTGIISTANGTSFSLTNSSGLTIATAGNNVTIDADGIHGPDFELTSSGLTITGGASLPNSEVGPFNGTHLDSTGVWTGSGSTVECRMGLLDGSSTYGFLAGENFASGKRAVLTKNGIKCYTSSGNLIFNTDPGTGQSHINVAAHTGYKAIQHYMSIDGAMKTTTLTWTLTGAGSTYFNSGQYSFSIRRISPTSGTFDSIGISNSSAVDANGGNDKTLSVTVVTSFTGGSSDNFYVEISFVYLCLNPK